MEETNGAQGVIIDLGHRVGRLELNFQTLKDSHQQNATELALIQKDISYIRSAQDKVAQGINRILWAIALSILGAVVTFILSGGLMLRL